MTLRSVWTCNLHWPDAVEAPSPTLLYWRACGLAMAHCHNHNYILMLPCMIYRGFSNVPWRKHAFGPVPSTVFKMNFWAFLGPCEWGRGRPWYGTSAQPEGHFTCSSPRCAPRVVPSTFLLNCFWGILRGLGRGEGAPLVRYLCKTHRSLHGRHVSEMLNLEPILNLSKLPFLVLGS